MVVCLQSLSTKGTLHPLPTLHNNEPVPQVLKQVVNLSCFPRLDTSNPPELNPITIVLDSPPETTRPEVVDFLAPNLNLKEEIIPFEDEEEDEIEIIHITELKSNRLRLVMIVKLYVFM